MGNIFFYLYRMAQSNLDFLRFHVSYISFSIVVSIECIMFVYPDPITFHLTLTTHSFENSIYNLWIYSSELKTQKLKLHAFKNFCLHIFCIRGNSKKNIYLLLTFENQS